MNLNWDVISLSLVMSVPLAIWLSPPWYACFALAVAANILSTLALK